LESNFSRKGCGFSKLSPNSQKVKWWFKNGKTEKKYSAVLRNDNEGAFYRDFVVQFFDGSIGIFDPKAGRTAETGDAGPRTEGLQKYIKEQNKKGKNLWGGIVINTNGTWRFNDNEKYAYDKNNLSSWKILPL
jgi:type III restriction enzyme